MSFNVWKHLLSATENIEEILFHEMKNFYKAKQNQPDTWYIPQEAKRAVIITSVVH